MSSNIRVTMSSSRLEVAGGETLETSIAIRNQSQVVDQFAVKIDGLDPQWWSLSTYNVSLFPGDQDEIKLTIRPPKDAEAKAGNYQFQVKVISQSNTQDFTTAEGYLVLKGFMSWEVEMSPTKIKGRSGIFHIKFNNHGNSDVSLKLEGKDLEEALIFQLDKNTVSVPAGGTAQVNLTVKPKKGEPERIYNFQISAIPEQARATLRETKTLNGQLEYPKRKFPWWILGVIFGLLALAAAAYVVMQFVYKPGPIQQVTISITAPKTGDSWAMASTQTIKWTANYTGTATVTLEYSTDGGATYSSIASKVSNTGSYSWKVPSTTSSKCLVRISLVSSSGSTLAKSTSGTFTMYGILKNTPAVTPDIKILK